MMKLNLITRFALIVIISLCSYTGTFALHCVAQGAKHVTNVDVSQPAFDIAKRNLALNNLDESKVSFLKEDVFKLLRRYKEEGKKFDMIILDPPKFVDSKSTLNRAARGYKDINLYAMKSIRSGGFLSTFSCSSFGFTCTFALLIAIVSSSKE